MTETSEIVEQVRASIRNQQWHRLRTQLSDGSWLAHTRTFPFQVYKESGFPHGKDQWISAAASSWAAMALSLSAPSSGQEISGF